MIHREHPDCLPYRRSARRLVEILEEIEQAAADDGDFEPKLAEAVESAYAVIQFFAPEYYVGRRALSLARDLEHSTVHLTAYPESWSFAKTAPDAALWARSIERFLLDHGAPEIATAFGRARMLHDNGQYIIIFAGMTSAIACYAFLSVLMASSTAFLAPLKPYMPWLAIAGAVICGLVVAVEIGVAVSEVLKGEHVVPAWPLGVAARRSDAVVDSPSARLRRYEEEFRAAEAANIWMVGASC